MKYGCDTLKNKFIMYHISPRKNRELILKEGLKINLKNSGFGVLPVYNAVYLMADRVRDAYMIDMLSDFHDIDIYMVEVHKDLLMEDGNPDEDSECDTWQESLESHGTLCVSSNIPVENVSFWYNVNNNEG